MKTQKYVLVGLFIFASGLGIFGQDIAYFFGDVWGWMDPLMVLLIVTIVSILLYLIYIYRSLFLYVKRGGSDGRTLFVIFIGIFFAVVISFWSLFVLVMWWG